jgi:hypothetical protein
VLGADSGKDFIIYVRVYTVEGYFDSDYTSITLADVPDQPTTAPYITQSSSSASKLVINYDALSTSENGGSTILSYSLEWDYQNGGEFEELIGYTKSSMATSLIILMHK